MKRRLGAAMALIGDPKLVLMDEPTSGVDPGLITYFTCITFLQNI